MAVDEKFVEKVGEEKSETDFDYGKVLDEFGASADFVEDKSGITVPADYWNRQLSQLPPEEIFAGKPHLGVPEKVEWTDKETGEVKSSFRVKLIVIDDAEEEAYTIPIRLNSDADIHENLFPSSKLYTLQMGLMELKAKGISREFNRLTVDLNKLRDILEEMDELYFKVVMIDGGNIDPYKSFKIVSDTEI